MMNSPKALARIAGVLYLILVGTWVNEGFVAARTVRPRGQVLNDVDSIRSSANLFHLGFVGDFVAGVCWALLSVALVVLLGHVNRFAAGAMLTLAVIGGAFDCYTQLFAIGVSTYADYAGTFAPFAGSDPLTLLVNGIPFLGACLFGLWLAPLGYLVIKSGYFPRVVGVLLMVACCGYLLDLFTAVQAPGRSITVALFLTVPVAVVGELTFMLWLLVKGVRIYTAEARVAAWPYVESTGGTPAL